ncbi:thioredoxin-disulfide reductase [Romboutsia sp. 1001216sp1]|uniref:thioredoxin-disulfide reductase n=1 Tax=unclassified Romboutsia TaxID=2626894 RepID=UPI00189ECDF7|nr:MULTISPECIES: thioredoxin-disulfide reductase [unclassified Romboutsia]MDB8791145.1 thioredoxin-disulfide reductase [Romboutsia sp. 1001216sp1]MDB8800785.1 thioredoxin-disulfide reductase [Romboutsia sp. 1001216sp1]MDB8812184.1 thioredoxin-disulfide reductase [Romboutsia sp. 1001216sp1]
MGNIYDLIIIGSGPAGLSAGLYGARAKLKTLILEKGKTGGQIVTTHDVANYPGSVENASGPKLIARMVEQCKSFGAEMKKDNIIDVDLESDIKVLKGEKGEYRGKAVVIATGSTPRKLGVKGEKELTGKGVSYCATCDGDFFTDLEVFAIGGGNSAVEEGIFLTKFARKVTIVNKNEKLTCAKSIAEKAQNNPNIEFVHNTTVKELCGDGILKKVVFENILTGELSEYEADEEDGTMGVFVFIGLKPETEIFRDKIYTDQNGYIITDEDMKTNIEGVFAAGDCRVKALRQVVTATNDGAIATISAEKYIESKEWNLEKSTI